ncbi:E3 ubiquitin-protein ligase RNF14, partial [Stegodyphus mimosarum]
MDNISAQSEELFALQSIYEERDFIVEGTDPPCGRFRANVQLNHPFYISPNNEDVRFYTSDENESELSRTEVFQVEYLPPINLFFEFPDTYPSDTCPAFLLSCNWLTYDQLSELCEHLESLWVESSGQVILFRWIQFLQEETLEFLHINNCLDITKLLKYKLKNRKHENEGSTRERDIDAYSKEEDNHTEQLNANFESFTGRVVNHSLPNIQPSVTRGQGSRDCRAFLDLPDGRILRNLLKDFNEYKKLEMFENSWHQCNICFLNKKGIDFIVFRSCQHYFCQDCLKSYFEVQIREGNVNSLNCPEEKCSSQADGSLVKQIVNKDLFEKYDTLLLSRTLESMSDIAYCPRKACQCPLVIDSCGRMGMCPACKFVFCPFCKMAYHGVAPCNLKPEEKQRICDEYLTGDNARREELEKRHGKRVVRSLVEDTLSAKWIHSYSKKCPHCGASIEKTEGCNKMTCFRCGTFFCWLCMKCLKASNPYSHFSERSSECYQQLFPPDYLEDGFDFVPGEFLNFF